MTTEFRFIEHNPRRAMRGAIPVRVAYIVDGEEEWLWMTKQDIARNMMIYGRDPELVKAHEAYKMTRRDEVIRMARDAGVFTADNLCATVNIDIAERFAALVAAAERERCANACLALAMSTNADGAMALRFAAAIRALKDGEE